LDPDERIIGILTMLGMIVRASRVRAEWGLDWLAGCMAGRSKTKTALFRCSGGGVIVPVVLLTFAAATRVSCRCRTLWRAFVERHLLEREGVLRGDDLSPKWLALFFAAAWSRRSWRRRSSAASSCSGGAAGGARPPG